MHIRPFEPLNTNQLTNNKTSTIRPVLSHSSLHAHNPTTYLSRDADENKTVCVSSISTTHFVPKSISVESKERQSNSHSFKYKIKARFPKLQTRFAPTSTIKRPHTNGHLNFRTHLRRIGVSTDDRLPVKKIYQCKDAIRESSVQCFSFILTPKSLYSILLLTRAAISFHNLFTVHPGTAVTRQLVFRIPYMEVVQSAKKARKYETSGKISTAQEITLSCTYRNIDSSGQYGRLCLMT